MGSFHKVTDPDTSDLIWLALLSNGCVWTCDAEEQKFWRNDPLTVDFFMDQTLAYETLSDEDARVVAATSPKVPDDVREILLSEEVPFGGGFGGFHHCCLGMKASRAE